MKKKLQKKSAITKIASKSTLYKNTKAFESINIYKKAIEIIDQAENAAGISIVYKSGIGSTLNFEFNSYGISSTTQETI